MVNCKRAGFGLRHSAVSMLLPCLIAALLLMPLTAAADSIRALAELNYADTALTSSDNSGSTSKINTTAFIQRYNLSLDRTLYPNLKLAAGGLFEADKTDGTVNGVSSSAESNKLSPYADLSLANGFVSASTGYRRSERGGIVNGVAAATLIAETYTASLGLTPVELPTMDIFYTRRYVYDEQRLTQDVQQDSWTWSSRYQPRENLNLRYSGLYSDQLSRLTLVESENLSHSGGVSYATSFFDRRASLATSYTLSTQETKISATGTGGEVFTRLNPLNGLSATTPSVIPLITVIAGQLTDTPALLDGTARFNIVIPSGSAPPPVGTELNMGLAFALPTTVNTLFLQVISGVNLSPVNVAQVAARFTWDIYTSEDRGQTWLKRQTITNAPFDRDPAAPGAEQVGFILNIAAVTTQFIKAVIAPQQLIGVLPPVGVDLNSIQVTRLQGLLREQAQDIKGRKNSSVSGSYNVNFNASILDIPALSYNMNFALSHSKGDGPLTYQYGLTNGLSLSHVFNSHVSGSARVASEYYAGSNTQTFISGIYSVGVAIVPLPTLNHTIVLSGRLETSEGKSQQSHSLSLTNSAQLYRGVAASLSGAYNMAISEKGRTSDTAVLTGGLSLAPHRTFSMSLGYQEVIGSQSGGGEADTTASSRTFSATAGYNPFPQLFLGGSYGVAMGELQETVTTANYSASWSPFPGGNLQFGFLYTESFNSSGNGRVRTFSPNLRWNIRRGAYLNMGYVQSKSTSDFSSSELSSVTSTLSVMF